jgi:hypothetical protein
LKFSRVEHFWKTIKRNADKKCLFSMVINFLNILLIIPTCAGFADFQRHNVAGILENLNGFGEEFALEGAAVDGQQPVTGVKGSGPFGQSSFRQPGDAWRWDRRGSRCRRL